MVAENNADIAGHVKTARTALIGIFTLLIIAAIYFARDFLIPVVLALFIAMTFRPLVRRLADYHIAPWITALGFGATLVLSALLAGYFASGPIAGWINDAPEIQRALTEKAHELRLYFGRLIHVAEQIEVATTATSSAEVQEVVVQDGSMLGMLSQYAGQPLYVFFTLAATVILAIFLMASGDLFYAKLVKVLPTLSEKKKALRIVYDVESDVSTYILTVSALNAGLAIAVGIAFYVLGMPTPFLWALMAFILNFIPYLGPLVGVSLTFLVGIVVFDTFAAALLPPVAYLALVGIESEVVTPLFLSRRLALNSVAILLSLAFWAWAWGIVGIIIAVPMLVTLKVFCSHVEKLAALGEFLGEADVSPAENGAVAPD